MDRDKIADILRAECNGNDLAEDDQGNLVALAERENGTLYLLGHIAACAVYQSKNPRGMIEKIKWRR